MNAVVGSEREARLTCTTWLVLLVAHGVGLLALHAFTYSVAYPSSAIVAWLNLSTVEARQQYAQTLDRGSHVLIPSVIACCMVFHYIIARRSRAVAVPGVPAMISRYALPALSIWAISTLRVSLYWSGWTHDFHGDARHAPARFLAHVNLDHPWPILGAFCAACILAWGVRAQSDPRVRWVLASLAIWAVARAALEGLEYHAAREFVAQRAEKNYLFQVDRVTTWIDVASRVWLLGAFVMGLVVASRLDRDQRRVALMIVVFCCGLSALMMVHRARMIGVDVFSAAERLERVLEATATVPLSAQTAGGEVHNVFAVLHHDTSMTFVDRDRSWTLAPGEPLFLPKHKLGLIVDERCTIADLVKLVSRVPEDYVLSLGRVVRAANGDMRAGRFPAARAAQLTVLWAPFVNDDRLLVLWPDAKPQDLSALPQTAPVIELAVAEPLRVAGGASAPPSTALGDGVPSPSTDAWWLLAWPGLR